MRWRRFIESLMHPALLAPESVSRSRFVVECLLLGTVFSFLFTIAYAMGGKTVEAWVTLPGAVSLLGCLIAMRSVRSTELVTWVAMLVCLVLFSMPAVTEEALDPAVLAWVSVVPYVAALLLPPRQAVAWLFISIASVLFLLWLRGSGPMLPPDFTFTTTRVLALVITIFIFGFRFARQQANALVELERSNRAKSAFLATMSHEIRTPMNGVLGITEVLLAGPLDLETREKLSLVKESGHSLVALINDILDYSKMEAGKLKAELVDFELRQAVDEVTGLHSPVARLKGVELVLSVASTVPEVVRGDALRLRQVLNNLISNAVKFTERGAVRVTVESPESGLVRFTVADTGIGIAPGTLSRLFTPFEQGDGGTTRRFGGTGLGLALSQNLVRLMGGEIRVESLVGVGSRFSFELPLSSGVLALARGAVESQAPATRTDLPVLVVDDNAINLKVACSLVEKAGYRTETAENGKEALELVQRRQYLLVLMDCHMPVMDGFAATEQIRALDGPAAMTPVVALTASAMPEELEACKRAGMNDCLTKPVSLQQLKSLLHRIEHYRGITDGAA